MQLFDADSPFTMNYSTYDQNAGLFVAFSVYDISTGTAVFLTKVAASHLAFGVYAAEYVGTAGKTYLAIGAVYSDVGHTTLEPYRAPVCDTYQAKNVQLTSLSFAYGAYDENNSLFLRANIYDVTSGTPTLIGQTQLVNVSIGVYLGAYVGAVGHSYEIAVAVYTDGNYVDVDPDRSPACFGFNCILLSGLTLVLADATLEAQSLDATLEGNCA